MKKLFPILILFCSISFLHANTVSVSITNSGTLQSEIELQVADYLTVSNLTVSGPLNGTDILTLRRMMGRDQKWDVHTDGKLAFLDLSEATIVLGGEVYYISMRNRNFTTSTNYFPSYGFYGCRSLTNFILPKNLMGIGRYAFSGCSSLKSINIPRTIKRLNEQCFRKCDSLSSVVIEEGLEAIDEFVFDHCTSLCSVTLPKSLRFIDFSAFGHCTSLTEISIPDNVRSINSYAFSNCISLSRFVYPKLSSTMNQATFEDCTGLEYVSISANIKSIESWIFRNCTQLKEVKCFAMYPPDVEDKTFDDFDINNCILKVPANALESYLNTYPWNTFGEIIPFDLEFKENPTVNVTLTEAGTLKTVIEEEVEDYRTVTNLKISGPLNGTDVITLRQMMGWDDYSKKTLGILHTLDISEVSIVEGGDIYYMTYTTTNNSFPSRMFIGCTQLRSIVLPLSVNSISSYAFKNCSKLENVVIPENIKNIGWRTFYNCISLQAIELPPDIETIGYRSFYNCNNLNEINIPNKVTKTEREAFKGCTNLTKVTIGQNLTFLDDETFANCWRLTDIQPNKKLEKIDNRVFLNCKSLTSFEFQDSIKFLGNKVFGGCSSLKSITIPERITSLGNALFSGCTSLSDVYLHDSIVAIGNYVFMACSSLASINLPNRIQTIGTSAFSYSGLTSIILPSNIRSIPSSLFKGCKDLGEVSLPEEITKIKRYAFDSCVSILKIILPEGIDTMEHGAFYNCKGLSSIVIPPKIKSLNSNIFSGCSNLTAIEIPDSLEAIGYYAFENCFNLSSISLPSTVNEIGRSAFRNDSNLYFITCKAIDPPVLGSDVFEGVNKDSCILTVLPNSLESYANADEWKDFFNLNKLFLEIVSEDTIYIEHNDPSITTIKINSNTSWSLSCRQEWLILDTTAGQGNTSFQITAKENPDNLQREAIIQLYAEGVDTFTVTVIQKPNTDLLTYDKILSKVIIKVDNNGIITFEGVISGGSFSLFDTKGQRILSKKVTDYENIDIHYLPTGRYILQLVTAKENIIKKIFKN